VSHNKVVVKLSPHTPNSPSFVWTLICFSWPWETGVDIRNNCSLLAKCSQ